MLLDPERAERVLPLPCWTRVRVERDFRERETQRRCSHGGARRIGIRALASHAARGIRLRRPRTTPLPPGAGISWWSMCRVLCSPLPLGGRCAAKPPLWLPHVCQPQKNIFSGHASQRFPEEPSWRPSAPAAAGLRPRAHGHES